MTTERDVGARSLRFKLRGFWCWLYRKHVPIDVQTSRGHDNATVCIRCGRVLGDPGWLPTFDEDMDDR